MATTTSASASASESIFETLLQDIRNKAAEYCNAKNDGLRHKKSEIDAMKKAVQVACNKYNLENEKETYRRWLADGDIMRTVIRERLIHHCKKVSFKQAESGLYSAEINDTDIKASLTTLEDTVGSDVFAAEDWFKATQKFAFVMEGVLDKGLGSCKEYQPIMKDAAEFFNLPDGVSAASKDGAVIALQKIFDKIYYIEKDGENLIKLTFNDDEEKSCQELTFISNAMTRQGKGIGQIQIGDAAKMAELVLDCMHLNLTNGTYTLVRG